MDSRGITLGEKHSFKDYGLYLNSIYIPMPSVKTNVIDIPYADGSIDLTDVGGVNYKDREGINIEFGCYDRTYYGWASIKSQLANDFHGQKIRMILDDDKGYYYNVRLSVDSKKSNPKTSKITLTGTADPYKYTITSYSEKWLWNPFNFLTGRIIDTSNIEITDTVNTVDIPITGAAVVPVFHVKESHSLTIKWDGETFNMHDIGKYRFPAIKIGDREITMEFMGTGIVSIDFKGAIL